MSLPVSSSIVSSVRLRRRTFLTAAGASALAVKLGLFDAGSMLFAKPASPVGRARVRLLFVRPDQEAYWMSWPGATFRAEDVQAEMIHTLADAAQRLGVQLDISAVPLHDPQSIEDTLQQLRESPPDGLLVAVLHLRSWPQVQCLARERGHLPLIVFSPLGTGLSGEKHMRCDTPRTFVAATQDLAWLADGLRMLRTTFDTQHTRICILTDAARGERQIPSVGTVLHFVPLSRWTEELSKASLTEEMREIAKSYGIEAREIGEPEKEDLYRAAQNYVVARRIMAAEQCQGISVDCAQLVGEHRVQCGMCLAWSRLLDEGSVAACEADTDAAISLLLAARLFERPGFMQDTAPNTVHNTVIGSHCTCATKLGGFDQPPVPFSLRSHAESNTGVAMQVAWTLGQDLTIMKFQAPDTMLLGTGRVVDNVRQPWGGGCRTAVEVEVDGLKDARDLRGHHQLFVAGKLDGLLKAYCQLADLKVVPVV